MRQLAAIMFTDIVGYTALMQSDEKTAVEVRSRHRSVFEATHSEFNGSIIQYFGDGTLSIFNSAIEAVRCATEIQNNVQNGSVKVPLRIGIHVGDVFFDGTEVYGDGVNVASRIEQISETGSVFISETVNRELANQPEIPTLSLGTFNFKNVQQPIEVFAVSTVGLQTPDISPIRTNSGDKEKTVAVLPFENLSSNAEQDYFCDGITEEIITALTKVQGLKVTSRTSSFHFRKSALPGREIGIKLGVSTLVIGSIRIHGDIMRITAQLIDVEEDFCFWSEKYDRSIRSLFEVQDEISLNIAEHLREQVGHLEFGDSLINEPNVSVDGYAEYLRARYLLLKMNPDDIKKGMSILERLITQEPNFVFAHLGMHMGFTLLGTLGLKPAMEAFTQGHIYLMKAIELDHSLPECQLQQAWISFLQDRDLVSTYEHLQKVRDAAQIVDYYQTMASVLVVEKKFKAASHFIDQALQLDPFSEITHHLRGFVHYVQSEFDAAIASYQKTKSIRPESGVSVLEWGQSLILLGKTTEAFNYFRELPAYTDPVIRDGGMALALLSMGKPTEAHEYLKTINKALETDKMERALQLLVLSEALQKNYDKVLTHLRTALSLRLPMLVYMKIDPMLADVYRNEDCKKLLDSVIPSEKTPETFEEKYQQVLIEPDQLPAYRTHIIQLMEQKQSYLDPFLTLKDLAEQADLAANQLSQLINAGFNQNFSGFVNSFRIQHFKELVRKKEHKHLTILALAYQSGFNSKTAFNTFFKKSEGISPSAYLKSVNH